MMAVFMLGLMFSANSVRAETILQGLNVSFKSFDSAQVEVNADDLFPYTTLKLKAVPEKELPFRYVVDIINAKSRVKLDRKINHPLLKKVRTGRHIKGENSYIRIVFDLAREVEVQSSFLITSDGRGKLIITFGSTAQTPALEEDNLFSETDEEVDLTAALAPLHSAKPEVASALAAEDGIPGVSPINKTVSDIPGVAASHLDTQAIPGVAASHLGTQAIPGVAASHSDTQAIPGVAPINSPAIALVEESDGTQQGSIDDIEPEVLEIIKPKRPKIVIDAGHGGIDTGAIQNGIHEKDIVRRISQMLVALLQANGGFEVIQTRNQDVKIPLIDRVKKAQEEEGDIFMSIHADALPSARYIKGASVYVLSDQASDDLSRSLASAENSVDGFDDLGLDGLPPDLKLGLSDIQLQATISNSRKFAGLTLQHLSNIGPIAFQETRSANFAVLRSSMVSILVETGFLTNEQDAQRLSQESQQQLIAQALFEAIKEYTANHLISREPFEAVEKQETETLSDQIHTVTKGQTLYRISIIYDVAVEEIKARNNLVSNNLVIGQQIYIPR